MISFRLIRKIGKMLRGGAGKREIFLGALCGVLIGFNPVSGLILFGMILLTLLLNANIGFTLLGVLVGKIASLALAFMSFQTGFFIIHKIGLENLFITLTNTPVLALMNLDVYAMIGSLPYALFIGIAFALFMQKSVTKIREQMLKAGENQVVAKTVNNTLSKFLMWLVFGKQKLSVADVLAKKSPLLRKSGLIFVAILLLTGFLFEFLFFDILAKKSLQTSIETFTGAEVNIKKAHLSLATGTYELSNLQITDPDNPSKNSVVIDTLIADLSIKDLLRRRYSIDRLIISTLQRDVPRKHPGKVFRKKRKKRTKDKKELKQITGKPLDYYFAEATKWEQYSEKAYYYLKKRQENAEAIKNNKHPKPDKQAAIQEAQKQGYLKARADLVLDHPRWTIHYIEIKKVKTALETAPQKLIIKELSSHPEQNKKPTSITLTSLKDNKPTVQIILHFENPKKAHEVAIYMPDISLKKIKTSKSIPVNLKEGKATFTTKGTFTAQKLSLPFTFYIQNLKTQIKDGKSLFGLNAPSAEKILNSLNTINLNGKITGSLRSPKIQVNIDNLMHRIQNAAITSAKKELSKQGKKELSKQSKKQIDKFLKTKDGKKAKKYLKGFL